jgi:hypothetical protein
METKQHIIKAIQSDSGLSEPDKELLLSKLNDDKWFDKLMHGTTGASVGYLVSKFFGLSRKSQVLLTVAGFGIGRYLLDNIQKRDKFMQYNDKLKTYEIKQDNDK